MKIGLIDVDGHDFPNLPLMKLSAWHKARGDTVEWYQPLFTGHCDKVYMSKVFSFTEDYQYFIDADEVVKGGSGYCIYLGEDGKEHYNKEIDINLPYEIEHIYPDYSIYPTLTENKAFGRLTLGCPRGCDFCHTGVKDGLCSNKVADLSEFWRGQKEICLLDQNLLACREWKDLMQQLIDSKAYIEFNGGLDIRLMTEEKAEMISKLRIHIIHFAWDRYEDGKYIKPKLEMFKKICDKGHRIVVYVLCGFKQKQLLPEDIERVEFIKSLNFSPYVMLYDKDNIPKKHDLRKFQRFVNNKFVFWSCPSYEEYLYKEV